MKRTRKDSTDAAVLAECDFAHGVRGKYALRFADGSNVVVLDPDVASAFPDSESANKALRSIMRSRERGGARAVHSQ